MQSIIQGFVEAMRLLFTGDPSTYEIAVRSLLCRARRSSSRLSAASPSGRHWR